MPKHNERNPATGLRWNSDTSKWVKKVRRSIKGQAAYKQIVALGDAFTPMSGWLPSALTHEYLEEVLEQYRANPANNCSSWRWDVDRAIAAITLILNNRYATPEDKRSTGKWGKEWRNGWVYIPKKYFAEWVHSDYEEVNRYLAALEQNGEDRIIDVSWTYKYSTDADPDAYPRKYRINPFYQQGLLKNKRVYYLSNAMQLKAFLKKQERLAAQTATLTRQYLIDEAQRMFDYLDMEVAQQAIENDIDWKASKMKADEVYFRLESIKAGTLDFYYNDKDDFGERLHTPFTNLPGFVKEWIRIPGVSLAELDIKNSQFAFFASCVVNERQDVFNILKTDDDDFNVQLHKDLDFMQSYYDTHEDFKRFCNEAINGNLYEWLVNESTAHGYDYSRDEIKKMCFRAFFSNDTESPRSKELLSPIVPSVVELCSILNEGEKKTVPRLMQRMESRVMLELVCAKIYAEGIRDFFTVHDSVVCKSEDIGRVEKIFKQEFVNAKLKVPRYQQSSMAEKIAKRRKEQGGRKAKEEQKRLDKNRKAREKRAREKGLTTDLPKNN